MPRNPLPAPPRGEGWQENLKSSAVAAGKLVLLFILESASRELPLWAGDGISGPTGWREKLGTRRHGLPDSQLLDLGGGGEKAFLA